MQQILTDEAWRLLGKSSGQGIVPSRSQAELHEPSALPDPRIACRGHHYPWMTIPPIKVWSIPPRHSSTVQSCIQTARANAALKALGSEVLPGLRRSITTRDRGLPSIRSQCIRIECTNRISTLYLIPEQNFKMPRQETKIKERAPGLQTVLQNSPFYETCGLCVGQTLKDHNKSQSQVY